MRRLLVLHLKGEYFDAIKAGEKTEEYRLATPYWRNRLVNKQFENVELARGYPKVGDMENRLVLPWRGFVQKTITHPHFGPDPVEVFAINVALNSVEQPRTALSSLTTETSKNCILCANGNDLPDGEECQGCGRVGNLPPGACS